MNYFCKCCGYRTLDSKNEYDICPICYWEDDPFQGENLFYGGGANTFSLFESKANFEEFGACEKRFLSNVTSPKTEERDPNYLSSEEFLDQEWKMFKTTLREVIKEDNIESSLFNFFCSKHFKTDLDFSREVSEEILKSKKNLHVYEIIATLYFNSFSDNESSSLREYLLSEYTNSWEKLEEILNSKSLN